MVTLQELIVYLIFGPAVVVYGAATALFVIGLGIYLAAHALTVGAYRFVGCQPPKWTT